ncbi:unnamed protein product, partial [Porites evermanni]
MGFPKVYFFSALVGGVVGGILTMLTLKILEARPREQTSVEVDNGRETGEERIGIGIQESTKLEQEHDESAISLKDDPVVSIHDVAFHLTLNLGYSNFQICLFLPGFLAHLRAKGKTNTCTKLQSTPDNSNLRGKLKKEERIFTAIDVFEQTFYQHKLLLLFFYLDSV